MSVWPIKPPDYGPLSVVLCWILLLLFTPHILSTHQVAGVTSDGQQMSRPRGVTTDDGVDLAALQDAPDALAVADVDAPVHAHGQALGERESRLSGRAAVTASGNILIGKLFINTDLIGIRHTV